MTVTIPVPRPGSLMLVLVGVVLGAVLILPASAATRTEVKAAAAVAQTRYTSCPGLGFAPMTSTETWTWYGTARGSLSGGTFVCAPVLPHRAVVTAVRFSLHDDSDVHEVILCALVRHSLTVASMGTTNYMATVPRTGVKNMPGPVRLSDTTIDFATVNTNQFAYFLQCDVTGNQAGIEGVTIQYTIDPAYG